MNNQVFLTKRAFYCYILLTYRPGSEQSVKVLYFNIALTRSARYQGDIEHTKYLLYFIYADILMTEKYCICPITNLKSCYINFRMLT